LRWEPIQPDQVYLARVDDKRFLRGEDYFYRLELGARNPDLTAFIARRDKYSQAHQSIGVPKGNRVLTLVGLRSDTEDPWSCRCPLLWNATRPFHGWRCRTDPGLGRAASA
jgi:hypothetical protein